MLKPFQYPMHVADLDSFDSLLTFVCVEGYPDEKWMKARFYFCLRTLRDSYDRFCKVFRI